MDLEEIKQYCLSRTGAIEDYPFGPEPMVIKIASKIFAIISIKSQKPNVSLKCDSFLSESLRQEYSAITPGYHLSKQHWNSIVIDGTVPVEQLKWLIDHSYDLVYKSLTNAEKQRLKDLE